MYRYCYTSKRTPSPGRPRSDTGNASLVQAHHNRSLSPRRGCVSPCDLNSSLPVMPGWIPSSFTTWALLFLNSARDYLTWARGFGLSQPAAEERYTLRPCINMTRVYSSSVEGHQPLYCWIKTAEAEQDQKDTSKNAAALGIPGGSLNLVLTQPNGA